MPKTPGVESAIEENVEAIKAWEQATLEKRSHVEQLSDWIANTIASGPSILAHVLWFGAWIALNSGLSSHLVFDPFPFPFLTMVVSLEAIFLSLFVLASQNRLSRQADKRSHLDLQVNLLAEREMTAVLQLLQDIASHHKVPTSITTQEIRELSRKTDLHGLTTRMEELAELDKTPPPNRPDRPD
jgi:uncharacterized membrane protein